MEANEHPTLKINSKTTIWKNTKEINIMNLISMTRAED